VKEGGRHAKEVSVDGDMPISIRSESRGFGVDGNRETISQPNEGEKEGRAPLYIDIPIDMIYHTHPTDALLPPVLSFVPDRYDEAIQARVVV
jgi:hypothetical protein